MTDEDQSATFEEQGEKRSSKAVLSAIDRAEQVFLDWQTRCQVIDDVYSLSREAETLADWRDAEMDVFWSSFEVIKPAVYARPPQPVVAPLFKDGKALNNTTAELLERCTITTFKQTNIAEAMLETRDDLIFSGRGVLWVRHENENGRHKVCVEHKDRLDFLHEPCRYWSEVGWVAGAAWLTKADMRKRFRKTSGNAYQNALYGLPKDNRAAGDTRSTEQRAVAKKCKVWEVHHKADNKIYWVTEGVDVLLDESEPEVDIEGFFPCPRPAYATLQRRSLIPTPDYERYAGHFEQINELTRRIYSLVGEVRMRGLIPAGGDVADALQTMIRNDRDDTMLIEVPQAALTGDASNFVQWMPLEQLAASIQGLIEARRQFIEDFYQLSGISDIMRGATEAEETLGAQQLKSQYGSVRVREKSNELQRLAADAVKIAAQIIAEKFPQEQILEMSQMDIPSEADIKKQIKAIEDTAKQELDGLAAQAQQAAEQAMQSGEQVDRNQAKMLFQQGQQQVLAKYAPQLAQAENQVAIEDVMDLLRDDHARSFIFEIESSSTILTDELQEKQSRNEFLQQFTTASASLMQIAAMGEPGAKLAGSLMKFALAPYRAGRDLDGAIEEFIDAAPQMAAAMGEGDDGGLAEANAKLADAEMAKAQAAQSKVEADSQFKMAEMQRKMGEMQQKAQEAEQKAMMEVEKLRQGNDELLAKIDLVKAQTIKTLTEAGIAVDKQNLDEFKSLADIEFRQADAQRQEMQQATDNAFRVNDSQRAAIESERSNARADRGEVRADRQQDFAERQPPKGNGQ